MRDALGGLTHPCKFRAIGSNELDEMRMLICYEVLIFFMYVEIIIFNYYWYYHINNANFWLLDIMACTLSDFGYCSRTEEFHDFALLLLCF